LIILLAVEDSSPESGDTGRELGSDLITGRALEFIVDGKSVEQISHERRDGSLRYVQAGQAIDSILLSCEDDMTDEGKDDER
jgi:hypothetical protein